jgi:outer membrane protein TolC
MGLRTQLHAPLLSKQTLILSISAVLSAIPGTARALEPLAAHLASAAELNLDVRAATARLDRAEEETSRAWAALFPALSARGTLARNQYEAIAPSPTGEGRTIVPKNQRELSLQVEVPIIDVFAWGSIAVSRDNERATEARRAGANLEMTRAVTAAWYQVVGGEALVSAAARAVEAAEKNREFIAERNTAGLSSELDLRRAEAEVERNRQTHADAMLALAVARRSLHALSGLEPTPGAPALEEKLDPPESLEVWTERALAGRPSIAAADADAEAAAARRFTAIGLLLPKVSANGAERFTNAPGFGEAPNWTVSAVAEWKLDPTAIFGLRAEGSNVDSAQIESDRARLDATTEVHSAWHRVTAQIAKSRAARAEEVASRLAVALARDRLHAGTATLLDVILVERDALAAEVARIRADADLAYARTLLSTSAGQS